MPTKSQWLVQLPKIIAQLKRLDTPVMDRACIEDLFGVGRRRAIQLMHSFGGYQSGKTFLIDRQRLIATLSAAAASDTYHFEKRRKQRVSGEIEKLREYARASRVAIPVAAHIYETRLSSLPSGVKLEPGRLLIEYSSPEQLLERLFALSQALVNDLELLQNRNDLFQGR